MSNLAVFQCGGGTNINSKIQYEINKIYLQDSYLWNNDNDNIINKCPNRNNWYLRQKALEIDANPNIPKGIDVFFTNSETAYNYNVINNNSVYQGANYACSMYPTGNYNEGSYVHMPDCFIKYHNMKNWAPIEYNQPWDPVIYGWYVSSMAGTLVHELGHSLGLYHEYTCPSHNIMNDSGNGCTHDYLTDNQIYISHRNLAITNIRKFVKEMTSLDSPLIISNNQIIDFDTRLYRDIIIESGGELIVKCRVLMPALGKIIVKPNGKLIIDGGNITNSENGLWQGIEVWGTTNQPQNSVLNSPYQGIVELKNGAVIENAENAITLWHPGYWNSMGGIVYANNATFLNNRRSVEFMAYQNTTPNGNPVRNLSQFTNCTFKVDDNYRGGSSNPFSHHVTLWAVNGVFFTACNFLNEQSNKVYDPYNNKAIYSIDAGYTVNGSCSTALMYGQTCPDEYLSKSYFKGFNSAVHASGSSSNNIVKIEDAVFDENFTGVNYEALNNSWVNKSNFFVGLYPDLMMNQEGIIIYSSTGYRIEENELKPNPNISDFAPSSIRVRNSGTANNQIYKNITTDLYCGERAEGLNRNPNNNFEGLKILCNSHSGTEYDISINQIGTQMNSAGICPFQGNPFTLTSAGNTFSQNGNNPESDIQNSTQSPIIYYHTGGQTEPIYYTPNFVFPLQVNNVNTCLSNFNNGHGFPLSAVSKIQLSTDYDAKELAYTNVLYNYNQLIDGGSTTSLLQEIQMSWPQDAWDLRAELLSNSPYLSEEVLREAANRNILPQAMMLEICLANPDGTRNEDFIRFLRDEIPNPLPEYMLDLIVANWEAETSRTLLEGSLADIGHKMSFTTDLLINNALADSIQQINEARSWMARRGSLTDYYSLAESFLASNDFTTAESYLSQIPTQFNLTDEQYAEYTNFVDYINFRESIAINGKNIMQLEGSELEQLQQIADLYLGKASVMAQNILCFGYQICYDNSNPLEYTHLKFSKPKISASQILNEAYNKVDVIPNPASVYASFIWNIPLLKSTAEIRIFDANAKIITQKTINTKQGQWVWDTRAIKNGVYYYEVLSENQQLSKGKIIINN